MNSEFQIRNSELHVAHSAIATVVAHARAESPRECCGILVGADERITEAIPARNIAGNPARFLIDPQDHIDAIRDARRRGLEVLGFYHSHPHSAPQPSERDVAEATYPNHLHLIVGLASDPPEIGLFRFTDGNFRELALVTSD